MSIAIFAFIVGLILALVEEFQANGRSIVGWGLFAVCIGLLWGHVG